MKRSAKPANFDSENPEWSASDLGTAQPAGEVLPLLLNAKSASRLLRPRGRPRSEFPKERINIRLSHDVLNHFKSDGVGWQTRIDAALREHIAQLTPTQRR
jgi:uncharacterized protein (DUF4415 family)